MTSSDAATLAAYSAQWLRRRRVRGRPLAPRTVAGYRVLLRGSDRQRRGQAQRADTERTDDLRGVPQLHRRGGAKLRDRLAVQQYVDRRRRLHAVASGVGAAGSVTVTDALRGTTTRS